MQIAEIADRCLHISDSVILSTAVRGYLVARRSRTTQYGQRVAVSGPVLCNWPSLIAHTDSVLCTLEDRALVQSSSSIHVKASLCRCFRSCC